jgi:hypothetical protein
MARAQTRNTTGADEARDARLLGLLLVDALQTMARERRGTGTREIRQWICHGNGEDRYSFERACETFGLPPVALRRRLGLRVQSARRKTTQAWLRNPSRR